MCSVIQWKSQLLSQSRHLCWHARKWFIKLSLTTVYLIVFHRCWQVAASKVALPANWLHLFPSFLVGIERSRYHERAFYYNFGVCIITRQQKGLDKIWWFMGVFFFLQFTSTQLLSNAALFRLHCLVFFFCLFVFWCVSVFLVLLFSEKHKRPTLISKKKEVVPTNNTIKKWQGAEVVRIYKWFTN